MSVRLVISSLIALLPLIAQERIPTENLRIIQIYEVRDLVALEGRSPKEVEEATTELGVMLRSAIPQHEHTSIEAAATGRLVVHGTVDQHAALRTVLEELREQQRRQYLMRFVIAWMPAANDEAEEDPMDTVFLETFDPEVRFEGGDVLSMPNVLTLAYEKVEIKTGKTVRFIEGYRVFDDVEGHPEGLAVPWFRELDEGVEIEARPVPSLDRKFVILAITFEANEIVRPVPVEQTEHGPVHRPAISTRSLSTTITVPDGGSVLLRNFRPSGDRRRLCLMLNVQGLE